MLFSTDCALHSSVPSCWEAHGADMERGHPLPGTAMWAQSRLLDAPVPLAGIRISALLCSRRHHPGGACSPSCCGAAGSSPGPAPAGPRQVGHRLALDAGWARALGGCWHGCAGKPRPAASLARWEAVTFLGDVPARIFLSQIRAEACQEIHSEPAMLLLSVPTQRALLSLLPPTPSSGPPPSSPQLHVRLPVPRLQPQRCCWSPAPHSPAMGSPAGQEVIKETAKPHSTGCLFQHSVSSQVPRLSCFSLLQK